MSKEIKKIYNFYIENQIAKEELFHFQMRKIRKYINQGFLSAIFLSTFYFVLSINSIFGYYYGNFSIKDIFLLSSICFCMISFSLLSKLSLSYIDSVIKNREHNILIYKNAQSDIDALIGGKDE